MKLIERAKQRIRVSELNYRFWRCHQDLKKVVVVHLGYGRHFHYNVKSIWERLRQRQEIAVFFVLEPDCTADAETILMHHGVTPEQILFADSVRSFRGVDLFMSPVGVTPPTSHCPKIQLFHGLAGWGCAKSFDPKAAILQHYTDLFLLGPIQKNVLRSLYNEFWPRQLSKVTFHEIGYPNTDAIFANGAKIRDQVIREYRLQPDLPIVIYAPTWEKEASLYTAGKLIIETMAALPVNLLVKLHPGSLQPHTRTGALPPINWTTEMARLEQTFPNVRHIIEQSAGPFLIASDIMIGDVSGLGFEYLLLNKPIVYYDCPEFFERYGTAGVEYWGRSGGAIVNDVVELQKAVEASLANPQSKQTERSKLASQLVYNPGRASEVAARKVLRLLGVREQSHDVTITKPPVTRTGLPLISVVVPVYNGERTIARCIESLLKLDYPADRHEIIIVDNNSMDATAAVIKQYSVTYVLESAIQTAGAARNAGVRIARGEILAFIDGDCVAEAGWLRNGVAALMADETIGCVGGRILSFCSEGPTTTVERFQIYNRVFEGANREDSDPGRLPRAVTGNVLYRRPVFDDLCGFRQELRAGEDADLSWRMQLQTPYRLVFSEEACVHHQHIQTLAALLRRAHSYGVAQAWEFRNYPESFNSAHHQRYRDIALDYWNLGRHFGAAAMATIHYNAQLLRPDVDVEKIAPVYRFLSHGSLHLGRIRGSLKHRVLFP